MRDQSRDQVNGRSSLAASAICERALDIVVVLESTEIFGGRFDGSGLCAEFEQLVKPFYDLLVRSNAIK